MVTPKRTGVVEKVSVRVRRKEYDFRDGVRGKHARRYARGTNLVLLEPEVAKAFPTAKAVNRALRALVKG